MRFFIAVRQIIHAMQNFLLKYLNKNKNKIAYKGFIFFFIIILDFAIDIIQTRKKRQHLY